jgi:hydroxymethylpyrimidine pyrophosphatase-like HAD family hydrolase
MQTKGRSRALAESYNIDINKVIAFGDATNDIPYVSKSRPWDRFENAHPDAIAAAGKVSEWTNDEDAIAREWKY